MGKWNFWSGSSSASVGDAVDVVRDFGAKGDGVAADATAIQAAINSGLPVVVPPGTYLINGDLIVPSQSKIIASTYGPVAFVNSQLRIEGSSGTATNITIAVAKGGTVITVVSTTGLAAGGWVRLVSSINANSNDAGVDQLGGRKADNSFLSEFGRIKSVDSSTQITLDTGTTWPYPITAGADSATRTTSTVIPVTFNENARVEGIKFTGRTGSNTQVANLSLARGARLINCDVDTNGAACFAARMSYCLDSHLFGGQYTGNPGGATASENVIIFRSSTGCTIRDSARVAYGFQGVDVTYVVGDTTLWGGPSISCGAEYVSARGQTADSYTDHPGVYRTLFENVTAYGAVRGVRLRGRASKVLRSAFSGHITNGVLGIFVEGGFTAGWEISNCDVEGFALGISWTPDEGSSTSRPTTNGTASGLVADNSLNGCGVGIQGASPANINALIHSVQVKRNTLRNIVTNPIYVSSYVNGVDVEDNAIFGVASGRAGITYEANVKRLRIGSNLILGVDPAGNAVKGPSTLTFMSDLTTFPAGNAEAFLSIGAVRTDATTRFSNIIRDFTAFDVGVTGPGSALTDYQVFTGTSSTWTKPLGAKVVRVILIAAGAGGGAGRRGAAASARFGGGGGGAGSKVEGTFLASDLGVSETVTVGIAGTGGIAQTVNDTDGANGLNGGTASFGAWKRANGGALGSGGTATTGTAGGALPGGGGAGGAGSATANSAGGSNNSEVGASGGGGGGGISSGNVAFTGGAGGGARAVDSTNPAAGGAGTGANGASSTDLPTTQPVAYAGGGGGGSGDTAGTIAGGTGGKGGNWGGGGGGGGASTDGANSGAGGAGGNGICVVISYF